MKLPVKYDDFHYTERWKIREEYIRIQKGLCCYCNHPLAEVPPMLKEINRALFPNGFFNHPVHLHHSHDTGMTIGAIHCYCNAVSWEYDGV